MQFLKTLFWVLLAVIIVLFASRNWFDVEVKLWGDIVVDIRLPLLILVAFLAGFLPTFIVQRARLWAMRRRIEAQERQLQPAPPTVAEAEDTPVL